MIGIGPPTPPKGLGLGPPGNEGGGRVTCHFLWPRRDAGWLDLAGPSPLLACFLSVSPAVPCQMRVLAVVEVSPSRGEGGPSSEGGAQRGSMHALIAWVSEKTLAK